MWIERIDYAYDDGVSLSGAKYLHGIQVTYPGPSSRTVVHYNHRSSMDDPVGNVLSRLSNIASASSGGTEYASYTYLGAATIAKINHPAVTNDLVLNYDPSNDGSFSAWDTFGEVTDQKWTNSTTIDEYGYAYDYDGNRKYRQNSGPGASNLDEAYTYDDLDRVTDLQRGTLSGSTISGTPAREQQFTLDELGNWPGYLTKTSGTTDMSQTRTHDKANELTHISGVSWVSPAYDLNGNMTDMPIPGNESTKQTAVYDAWNRLVQVKDNSGTVFVTYRYNGLNWRVQKLLGSPSLPDHTYDYYYNESWQVLEERKGGSTNPYAQYVWDARYIDAPVVRFHDSNTDGTLDDTLYYATDANMNITALVSTAGDVVERSQC